MVPVNDRFENPVIAFRDAMRAAGMDYSGDIIADGALHRFKAGSDRNPNSWYVLHADGLPAGAYGDYKRNVSERWCAKSAEALSPEERAERDRIWKAQAEARAQAQRQQHTEASAKAQAILDAAAPATDDHPYLQRKGVKASPGVKVGHWAQRKADNCLLIPLRRIDGTLATVQAIFPEKGTGARDKDFLRGGSKTGAFFAIGDLASSERILIAEGYATGATLHAATGYAVAVAIDAGNLRAVAEALTAAYRPPEQWICIAADNDRATAGNPGLTKASAAAKAVGVRLVVPHFAADDDEGSDFNDLAAFYGDLDCIRSDIERAFSGPWKPGEEAQGEPPVQSGEIYVDPFRGTDEGNAALFLKRHGSNLKYCPPWNKWLTWTGTHWAIDDAIEVRRLAADLPRDLYHAAGEEEDSKQRKIIAALARNLESTNRQAALIEMAKCRVVVHNSNLDRDHFLLNAANGTVDLRTGKLRAHQRDDLLTHNIGIDYDPTAECPTWTRFLHDVFAGDADLIEFIRRAIGYSLTGDVREQVMLICHGSGSNGKSVFLNVLQRLLGELALQAAPDLLMTDHNRRHPTEQADLYGRRAVVCQETEQGRRFNEVLVKQLTGGDKVRARRMREDFWQFDPTWKIWLSTNHRPEVRGTDHAIWRRIRLIPFNVTFHDPGHGLPEKDTHMEARLIAELPGILAWAVEGCLAWQRDGLTLPTAVRAATEEYREQQDLMAAWLGECCVVKKLADASAADLYASYSAWCEANGERPEPQRRFGMRLTERGFTRQRRMVGHFWIGIGLLDTRHEPFHDRNDPNDPELAINGSRTVREGDIGESGSYGSYGSCESSAAETEQTQLAEKQPVTPPRPGANPAREQQALDVLRRLHEQQRRNLVAGGISGIPRVRVSDWVGRLPGDGRATVEALVAAGRVAVVGLFVEVSA